MKLQTVIETEIPDELVDKLITGDQDDMQVVVYVEGTITVEGIVPVLRVDEVVLTDTDGETVVFIDEYGDTAAIDAVDVSFMELVVDSDAR